MPHLPRCAPAVLSFASVFALLAMQAALAETPGAEPLPAAVAALSPQSFPLDKIEMLSGDAPRAHFFRSVEGAHKWQGPFEEWAARYDTLMGIQGKALSEESVNFYPRNIEYFTRFKQAHPRQMVLLHMNGNARDPRFQTGAFFAGHWLYFNGARVLDAVPAEEGETEIKVSDARLFRTGVGNRQTSSTGQRRQKNEDVGLCRLDAEGKPNWRESEQVQLISTDLARNTIRVRRGQFGTKPLAFPAGQAYAAAHVTEGPWDGPSNLLWFYNYSTEAPRDDQGRSVADVLSDDVARRFNPGGELAAFDGLEFDVLWYEPLYHPDLRQEKNDLRGPDLNADGKIDAVYTGPANSYGVGVTDFERKLRAKMGDGKLIMADGMYDIMQRGFGILNGIESEGWPNSNDQEFDCWSSGLDRFWFWQANAHQPAFSYIRHGHGPKAPLARHRLAIAGAAFTDSGFSFFTSFPPAEKGEPVGIFDELRMGTEKRVGWLGKALGPAIRLATKQPDLLQQSGSPIHKDLAQRFESQDATIEVKDGRLVIAGKDPKAATIHFRLKEMPVSGPNLLFQMTATAELPLGAPPEIARTLYAGAGEPGQSILKPITNAAQRWRRAHGPLYNNGLQAWVNGREYTSSFYFRKVEGNKADIEFELEAAAPITISRIAAFAYPDAMYRLFEHGLVLANPSLQPYTFDLEQIAPGQKYRRLKGSSQQDPQTNDGRPVTGLVELEPKDAIFLVTE